MKRYWPLPALLTIAAALLYRVWGRVGDVFVDFGRELYVPWQITEGRVLYRDLAYLYGPLPPYVNALWWTLFGGADRSVIIGNLLLLAVACVLLYHILAVMSGRYAATAGVALFLLCGAFGATVRTTNYNFLTPYAHGVTHGVILGLGAVAASIALYRSRRPTAAGVVGVCVGLAYLTKPETFLAVGLAGAAGLVASTRSVKHIAAFAAGGLVPPLIAFGLLCTAMPPSVATEGMLMGWQHAGQPYVTQTPFYREGLGLEFIHRNAWKVVRYACLYFQFLAGLTLMAIILRKSLARHPWGAGALSLAVAAALFVLTQEYHYRPRFWLDIGRGLPLFPVVGMVAGIVWTKRHSSERSVALLAFSALAAGLLLKMGMNAKLFHYGFALATPAAVLGLVFGTGLLPEVVARVGGYPLLVRAGSTALALGVAMFEIKHSEIPLADRTERFDPPASLLAMPHKYGTVVEAVRAVRAMSPPDATLAVFPDGSGINFAAQRRNPTPYDICHPMTLAMYGESRVAEAYRCNPPDLILLAHQPTHAFGSTWFGETYAHELVGMLDGYEHVRTFGREGQMPIALFRRK